MPAPRIVYSVLMVSGVSDHRRQRFQGPQAMGQTVADDKDIQSTGID